MSLNMKSIRRAAVPLLVIETSDASATIKSALREVNGKLESMSVVTWDCVSGFVGLTAPGRTAVSNNGGGEGTHDPYCLPKLLPKLPQKDTDTIVFMTNAHKFWSDAVIMQGIANLRNAYKSSGSLLVMLCLTAATLPPELSNDVVVISDPLPTDSEIIDIIDGTIKAAKKDAPSLPTPTSQQTTKMVDTLLGLNAFAAEQTLAMSLTKEGVDVASMWDRKCKTIEQTNGLSVYRGKEKFSDIGGLANGKKIFKDTVTGKMRISAIVLIDELDKAMAASGTDSSGVTQDQNRSLLTYIQDNNRPGILELGPAGTGKTLLCKAVANECDIPLIMLDLGAMMSRYVGDSQGAIRTALKVIHAISSGRALFVGTCNRTDNLPPELRRRFNYSSIFFDLPEIEERDSAWKVHRNAFELDKKQCDQFDDTGWTGAEIHNCCLKAWAMGCKLSEAATTIVPISKTAAEPILALRKSASGKYISASNRGLYEYKEQEQSGERKIRF